jgi:FAD-dependent oxidoreductase domain-containing protein 1
MSTSVFVHELRDIVIVGGGVIAYFLVAAHGVRATVIERAPTYAKASSALSASSIRQQFSMPANIVLSQCSFKFLKEAPEIAALTPARVARGERVIEKHVL